MIFGENATYNSTDSVVGFVEALGTWVEKSLEKIQKVQFYSPRQFYSSSTILQPQGYSTFFCSPKAHF